MLFNSIAFLGCFLPIAWVGWRLVALTGRRAFAVGWLSLCSLVFYAYWNWHYAPLLVGSLLVNFYLGRTLIRRPRQAVLGLGLIWNIGLLGYFKYFNFFVGNIDALTGLQWPLRTIVLPLGISFFTFQKIAFLVDAWRGRVREVRFDDFALFVLFFPQLIAGPIVHHQDFIPQLQRPEWLRLDRARLMRGLLLFSAGLFCKTVIADSLAPTVNSGFAFVFSGFHLRLIEAWCVVVAYGLQLFYDFAGYSYMALGLALIFGLVLPVNFFAPYRSRSIIEFWRRWHITLSAFLRDYVYIPLGGNRRGLARELINVLITFLIAGLWHGAGWTFILWGLWHGVALILNHLWRHARGARGSGAPESHSIGNFVLTWFVVQIGWVLFRSPDLRIASDLGASLIGMNGISVPLALTPWVDSLAPVIRPEGWFPNLYLTPSILMVILASGVAASAGPTVLGRFGTSQTDVAAPPPVVQAELPFNGPPVNWRQAVLAGAMLALSLAALSRSVPFLYFQF